MSTIAITQLAVPSQTPADIQTLKVWPKTGKINLMFNSEVESNNDGSTKTGSTLNFALLTSDTGAANDWTLLTAGANSTTATTATSSALGTTLAVSSNAGMGAGTVVAVTGANVPDLNGVFVVSASSSTNSITVALPYPSDASSNTTAKVTVVNPITVVSGGQNVANTQTANQYLKIAGWGSTGGGYCRLDLQFNGLFGFGQIDIETALTKSGYGTLGSSAAGVGNGPATPTWPAGA